MAPETGRTHRTSEKNTSVMSRPTAACSFGKANYVIKLATSVIFSTVVLTHSLQCVSLLKLGASVEWTMAMFFFFCRAVLLAHHITCSNHLQDRWSYLVGLIHSSRSLSLHAWDRQVPILPKVNSRTIILSLIWPACQSCCQGVATVHATATRSHR